MGTGEPRLFTCCCGDRSREGTHSQERCEYIAGRVVTGSQTTAK